MVVHEAVAHAGVDLDVVGDAVRGQGVLELVWGGPETLIELQDGPVRQDMTVREVTGEEKAVWWERAVAAFPNYAEYQRRLADARLVAAERTDLMKNLDREPCKSGRNYVVPRWGSLSILSFASSNSSCVSLAAASCATW